MEIFIGADHRGFELKGIVKEWLEEQGHSVTDMGANKFKKNDDYPDYALAVSEEVAKEPEGRRGIVFCGSGAGVSIAANKVKGIRAAQARDAEIATVARADDKTNVLAIPADYIEEREAINVVRAWLATDFSGEDRHQRRIDKITEYENGN